MREGNYLKYSNLPRSDLSEDILHFFLVICDKCDLISIKTKLPSLN